MPFIGRHSVGRRRRCGSSRRGRKPRPSPPGNQLHCPSANTSLIPCDDMENGNAQKSPTLNSTTENLADTIVDGHKRTLPVNVEDDLIGPSESGTEITLEGIVWAESRNAGALAINVTWRGKTYVGLLLKNQHQSNLLIKNNAIESENFNQSDSIRQNENVVDSSITISSSTTTAATSESNVTNSILPVTFISDKLLNETSTSEITSIPTTSITCQPQSLTEINFYSKTHQDSQSTDSPIHKHITLSSVECELSSPIHQLELMAENRLMSKGHLRTDQSHGYPSSSSSNKQGPTSTDETSSSSLPLTFAQSLSPAPSDRSPISALSSMIEEAPGIVNNNTNDSNHHNRGIPARCMSSIHNQDRSRPGNVNFLLPSSFLNPVGTFPLTVTDSGLLNPAAHGCRFANPYQSNSSSMNCIPVHSDSVVVDPFQRPSPHFTFHDNTKHSQLDP